MLQTAPTSASFSTIIQALGTQDFEAATLDYLSEALGAEHYSIFRMKSDRPEFIGGASTHGSHAVQSLYPRHSTWRQSEADLRYGGARLGTGPGALVTRSEPCGIGDRDLRRALSHFHIVDRLVLCGREGDDIYGISMLRSARVGRFADASVANLCSVADVLVALFAKHASICWDIPKIATVLDRIEDIEARIRLANWGISKRELQVSARILHGVSALGIAHELGLREDTIGTYRKRLYRRLGISGRNELLRKYLSMFEDA